MFLQCQNQIQGCAPNVPVVHILEKTEWFEKQTFIYVTSHSPMLHGGSASKLQFMRH